MKLTIVLVGLVGLAVAKPRPQLPTPDMPPPPLTEIPGPATDPIPTKLPTEVLTLPPPTTSKDSPAPAPTKAPAPGPDAPICECGYTYCASVLMAMTKPWSQKQLADAYCKTPHAACSNNVPSTNVTSALYICLCDDIDQDVGDHLDLVCGCDNCLNIGPDFRGRCETPCHAGNCADEL